MAQGFSKTELLKFLDYLADKGLMKGSGVASRKAAVNSFLGILKPEEAEDLTNLNLDEVAMRFANLKGSQFKPESMRVYKSRVSSSLEDFKNYRKNPIAFKPSAPIVKNAGTSKNEKSGTKSKFQKASSIKESFFESSQEVSFPIPIRPNVIVHLVGIPNDLTKREATKIANVVVALAQDDGK
jgi:hypothetical protein